MHKDENRFDLLLNLLDGDEEIVKEVLLTFKTSVPIALENIRTGFVSNEFDLIRKKAHSIKPFFGYMNDDDAFRILERWEQESDTNQQTPNFLNELNSIEAKTKAIFEAASKRFGV